MTSGLSTVIYPVSDIGRAERVYRALLGVEPYVAEAYYVGFRVGDQELGLDPRGHRSGAVGYWDVEDIAQTFALLLEAGAEAEQPITDVGGGKLIASVRDADGNLIGLAQSPETRSG